MNRRQFLQTTIASCIGLAAYNSRVWAASPSNGNPRFLLIFLRGGYDSANLLVPYSSDLYYQGRPNIAVPKPSEPNGALELNSDWALHPSLKDTVLPLYQRQQAAFVPFAGTADLSRSHFETQDHIELGQGAHTRDFNSGFLNRLAAVLHDRARSIAFTNQLPLSMQGKVRIANQPVVGKIQSMNEAQRQLLEQMYQHSSLAPTVRTAFTTQQQVTEDMAQMASNGYVAEMIAASRGAINPSGFQAAAAKIGVLMRDHYNLGFMDLGGWDTHINQTGVTGAEGQLANKFAELGAGLAVLPDTMGKAWNETVVVVISEFGRTFRENGNRGTDHGHGSTYWVLGGGVHGGKIVGEQVALSEKTLNQNRDWPVLTDYRGLLGGLFKRLWGLTPAELQQVFPDAKPADLQLV
ncbi:DUF1501 domain-containing protein [Halothiobacillus sp.]|uniref:DUF1501 domain-containing protein n=1 Tax=Halothiobacillus sp. TaxID=1891311 RepID=UPI00263742D4|nr:DUF1501 domain-containing protein [Halothiobacillus sp.]